MNRLQLSKLNASSPRADVLRGRPPATGRRLSGVEVIVLITVFSILLLTAAPRFFNAEAELAAAATSRFADQLRGSVSEIQRRHIAHGNAAGHPATVTLNGSTIQVTPGPNGGFPTPDAAGLGQVLSCPEMKHCGGYHVHINANGTVYFTKSPVLSDLCAITYFPATGRVVTHATPRLCKAQAS